MLEKNKEDNKPVVGTVYMLSKLSEVSKKIQLWTHRMIFFFVLKKSTN